MLLPCRASRQKRCNFPLYSTADGPASRRRDITAQRVRGCDPPPGIVAAGIIVDLVVVAGALLERVEGVGVIANAWRQVAGGRITGDGVDRLVKCARTFSTVPLHSVYFTCGSLSGGHDVALERNWPDRQCWKA